MGTTRTVVLLRHGRSNANASGVLAGRRPGVDLDDAGGDQARALVARLARTPIARIVSSPLERCRQTVAPLARSLGLDVQLDERLVEVDYGRWTGAALTDLAGEPLWRTVQQHPSGAVFPDGESLGAAAARAVAAAREHAAGPAAPGALDRDGAVLICSHGDLIKAIVADALGMHLDLFQRLIVSPASLSVVRYTPTRPMVLHVNHTGELVLPASLRESTAAVGGDTGAGASGDTGAETPGDTGSDTGTELAGDRP